jgi:hypothetical protein
MLQAERKLGVRRKNLDHGVLCTTVNARVLGRLIFIFPITLHLIQRPTIFVYRQLQ